MKKPLTPFPTTGYFGSQYFCDREEETRKILSNIRGGQSTILTAPRRIGKTALIFHVLDRLSSGTRGIYFDILPTENMSGFLNEFASAIIRNVPERKGTGRKIWDFMKSLRPSVSFDMLTGSPQVSFSLKENEINYQIETIFSFLEKQDDKFVIAIDEFQQILKYPEKNTDAWLRTLIQKLKNVIFIFAGSQQHLLNEMFTIPSRPFYQSASLLKIDKINSEKYKAFIKKQFTRNDRELEDSILNSIINWADCHTYYVQLICNRIFLTRVNIIKDAIWKEEAERLLKEQEPVFFNYRSMLTRPQWDILKATALEGVLYEPTGIDFVMKYSLGNPSTVLRSVEALNRMELIYYDFNPNGKKYYAINDLLFRRWMEGLNPGS
jgi:AAA+ ATPase superfamily predicted ATPase